MKNKSEVNHGLISDEGVIRYGERLSSDDSLCWRSRILRDAAGHFMDKQRGGTEDYAIEIHYADDTIQYSYMETEERCEKFLDVVQVSKEKTIVRDIESKEHNSVTQGEFRVLRLENVIQKEINDIIVFDEEMYQWHSNIDKAVFPELYIYIGGLAPSLEIYFPTRRQAGGLMSVELAECGKSKEISAEIGESRYVFGYGWILAPAIPKGVSEALESLRGSGKLEMLQDVKKLLKIREENSLIIKALRAGMDSNVQKLPYRSCDILPIPYIYIGDGEYIAVAANPSSERDAEISFSFGSLLAYDDKYSVDVLYGVERVSLCEKPLALSKYIFKIGKDGASSGGLLAVKLTRRPR
jgi:hypothetical protein